MRRELRVVGFIDAVSWFISNARYRKHGKDVTAAGAPLQ